MTTAEQLSRLAEFERERCLALHEICRTVAENIAAGMKVRDALEQAARDNHRRRLKAGTRKDEQLWKELKLSLGNFKMLYLKWQENPSPLAFLRNYKPGHASLRTQLLDLLQEFRRRCTLEGMTVTSVAIKSLHDDWYAGKKLPGLGTWREWYAAKHPDHPLPEIAPEFPVHDRTFYRYAPKGALRGLGNKGVAEMKMNAPFISRDYASLRPAELYTADDARLDLKAIDEVTGRVTDVVVYLMMEVSCRLIVACVVKGATAICAADVDDLIARGLQVGGIGNGYVTHLLLERGTIAMSEQRKELLEMMSDGRVRVHRTGMDGGERWDGAFADKPSGHWFGKAMIESFMRKLHLRLMMIPGQTGPDFSKAPANLLWSVRRKQHANGGSEKIIAGGRAAEAEMLAQLNLQMGQRIALKMPLKTISEVTMLVMDAIKDHNTSPDHDCEGFDSLMEAEIQPGVWKPIDTLNLTVGEQEIHASPQSQADVLVAPVKKTYVLNSESTPPPTIGQYWAVWNALEKARPGINRFAITRKAIGHVPAVTKMSNEELAKVIRVFTSILRDSKS
jgi:hypothetical protein